MADFSSWFLVTFETTFCSNYISFFFIYSNKFIHKGKNKEAVLWGFLYPQNMANFMLSNKDRKKCLEIEYGHTSSV